MPTPLSEALPTTYEFGRVIGRFLRAVGDGEDVDSVPEAVPATGTVTFTPIVTSRILIDASAEPSPLITHEAITCTLDAYGHISRNGVRGVWLWTGEWNVAFNVSGISRTQFPILVTNAHTDVAPLDLWEAVPYTPPAGATVTTMLVPSNPTDGYVLKWSAASSSLVWDASSGGYPVQQVTLTGNLAYTLPPGAPADQVISVVFTQNTTGGHTVTYGGSPVTVDTAAGSVTTVELHPTGAGYVVAYPPKAAFGTAATKDVGTTAGTVKAGDWSPDNAPLLRGDAPAALDGRGIARPLRSAGRMLIGFGSAATWTDNGGAAAYITQGYTGFDADGTRSGVPSRTGQPTMLRWAPAVDAVGEIICGAGKTLTPAIDGQIVLVVHVATQPGYQPGEVNTALKGAIALTITTHATRSNANALNVHFNVNQVREGWNFLKFVQRNPAAYVAGSGVVEDHPFGVSAVSIGTGADTNIKDNPITGIKIAVVNMGGATLTFDSIWTGIDTQAQVVLGCDQATSDTFNLGLPLIQSRGWIGYTAFPVRMLALGQDRYVINPDASGQLPWAKQLYAAGWDACNHSANHLPGLPDSGVTDHMASLTSPGAIAYEVEVARQMMLGQGLIRGAEFYASPQSQSSRLSERVIREAGFKLQRHSRKYNVTVTPWGVDNLHNVGSIDMGSSVNGGVTVTTGGAGSVSGGSGKASRIIRQLQVVEAYGDTAFPFWHALTATGGAEDLAGDNITLTQAAFAAVLDHVEAREAAGALRVTDGITGFYYGTGR